MLMVLSDCLLSDHHVTFFCNVSVSFDNCLGKSQAKTKQTKPQYGMMALPGEFACTQSKIGFKNLFLNMQTKCQEWLPNVTHAASE